MNTNKPLIIFSKKFKLNDELIPFDTYSKQPLVDAKTFLGSSKIFVVNNVEIKYNNLYHFYKNVKK